MSILDNFAYNWLKWQEDDKKLRESLPQTEEEANKPFAKEMGWKIDDVLYDLREQVLSYCQRQGNIPIDAFIASPDAEMVYSAILELQRKCLKIDSLDAY